MTARQVRVKLEEGVGKVTRDVAFKALRNVIMETPKDTGRAQFGWEMTETHPSSFLPDKGTYATLQPTLPPAPEGPTVYYIVNNVPYVKYLDEGHSDQAPIGFVQTAVDKAAAGVR